QVARLEGVIAVITIVVDVIEISVLCPTVAEQNHLVGDQFGAKMLFAVFVFPAACLQPSLDVNLLVLGQMRLATLREVAPRDDVKPFGFLASLSFSRNPRAAGRNAETRHRATAWRVAHFRVTSYDPDNNDFIQTASHKHFYSANRRSTSSS